MQVRWYVVAIFLCNMHFCTITSKTISEIFLDQAMRQFDAKAKYCRQDCKVYLAHENYQAEYTNRYIVSMCFVANNITNHSLKKLKHNQEIKISSKMFKLSIDEQSHYTYRFERVDDVGDDVTY